MNKQFRNSTPGSYQVILRHFIVLVQHRYHQHHHLIYQSTQCLPFLLVVSTRVNSSRYQFGHNYLSSATFANPIPDIPRIKSELFIKVATVWSGFISTYLQELR